MPKGKHTGHIRGSSHHRWNPRIVASNGYVRLKVGKSHPLADPNGYAYEHVVVLASAGITVPVGSVVHHRNEDKQDNRLENLEIVTRQQHIHIHGLPGHNRKT